jgi:signal transduction histidine kinase
MTDWLRGKRGSFMVFALIVLLVAGGLGWLTVQALRMEQEQVRAAQQAEEDQHQLDRERQNAREQADRERRLAADRLQHEKDRNHRLQMALSLLDSRVLPVLVQEETRPFNHYNAVFAPPGTLTCVDGKWKPETALQPSPLLGADLPDWIVLHFQSAGGIYWSSPQIPSENLRKKLVQMGIELAELDPERSKQRALVLGELSQRVSPRELLALVERKSVWLEAEEKALLPNPSNSNEPQSQGSASIALNSGVGPTQPREDARNDLRSKPESQRPNDPKKNQIDPPFNYEQRAGQFARVQEESNKQIHEKDDPKILARNLRNEEWFSLGTIRPTPGTSVSVLRGRMVRFWLTTTEGQERLLVARRVRVGDALICQGLVLDWPRLQRILETEIADLFPEARFLPLREGAQPQPERTMSALPVVLDTGADTEIPELASDDMDAEPVPFPATKRITLGWTTLRIGLGLTWVAALVALTAVGLGGWSLLDLSQRRIRFVSAVTHELRTPLTTLRLYLDMLTGGMVKDEKTKQEYLQTLDCETDRLSRLIANVLDFSRLENQQPRLNRSVLTVAELLDRIADIWQRRCQDSGKQLVIEGLAPPETILETDPELLQQVLGNLIDNACKYSREAEDPRIWLRSLLAGSGRLFLEVEDRGPGISAGERRGIFQPFQRGRGSDVVAGGVGLGLALARRWMALLGGTLALAPKEGVGACFRAELPLPPVS